MRTLVLILTLLLILISLTVRLPSGQEKTVPRIRDIRRFTSRDFFNWSEPEYIEYELDPTEHLYKNSAIPYFRRPDLILMFPKRFLPERVFDPDWPNCIAHPIHQTLPTALA